ncbi:MAG: TIGR02147 family protein [Bdellovibrionales bacterium]|nr:TIGR02147 family protein [Bdellovibrionales bacterium]
MDQESFQLYLKSSFDELQSKNSSYSLRAFARKLEISPASLSEILNGKRKVSSQKAKKILERLCLPKAKIGKILGSLLAEQDSISAFEEISLDEFHVISDWYYFAVQSLSETQGFNPDPSWIAQRLNIKKVEAQKALDRLLDLGLLKKNKKGVLSSTSKSIATPTDQAHGALRKSHFQTLSLAEKSLEKDAVELRDFSNITIAMDPNDLPKAKKMIRDFRHRLCEVLESGEKKEVYKLGIQLFSLSNLNSTKEKK